MDAQRAVVECGYDPAARMLEIRKLFVSPGWITGLPVELVPGRGMPAEMYALLRQMRMLKVPMGGLRQLELWAFQDAESLIQLERAVRDGTPVGEAVARTRLFESVEDSLLQSGHKVVPGSIRIDTTEQRRGALLLVLDDQVEMISPDVPPALFEKYGVDSTYEVAWNFDVHVDLVAGTKR